MAIRDRFRRALRQSNSSDSISQSDSNSSASSTHRTSSSEAPSPISLIKTVSSTASLSSSFRLTKTFSFRASRDKSKASKASKEAASKHINTGVPKLHDELPSRPRGKSRSLKPTKTYLHPSQRPLTEQNLQHQEMLRHFTMTFGATNLAQIEEFDDCGISPCCTRACSIAGDLS